MRPGTSRAALSLGSNLGELEANLARARAELASYARPATADSAPSFRFGAGARTDGGARAPTADLEILASSRPRTTTPQGFTAQPDFLNQVLLVRTELSPWGLLDACLEVERRLGRVRGPIRWGPRTIDVDVLAYDRLVVRDARLTIPHAALSLRPFFLEMMREIGADELLP